MKYLTKYNDFLIKELYSFDIDDEYDCDDLDLSWNDITEYAKDNYDFESEMEDMGEDLFDYLSDYELQRYYDDLVETYIKKFDIEEYDIDHLRNYIITNEYDFSDISIKDDDDDKDFDDLINDMSEEKIKKILDDDIEFKYTIINNDLMYESVQDRFKNMGYENKDYYIELEDYIDKDKIIENSIDDEEKIKNFYLSDIETNEDKLDDLIKYNPYNILIIFDIIDSKSTYGKDLDFQKKYIDEVKEEGYDNPDDDDMLEIITKIDNKFGINNELKSKYEKYLIRKSKSDFNL